MQSTFSRALELVLQIHRTMAAYEVAMNAHAVDCTSMLRALADQYDAGDCNHDMHVAWQEVDDLVKAVYSRTIAKVVDITELVAVIEAERGLYERRLHAAITSMNDDTAR